MICKCGHTKDVHLRERERIPTPTPSSDPKGDPPEPTHRHTVCNAIWCDCKSYQIDKR